MLVSAAFGLYPYVLVARGDAQFGLTISNAAAAEYGLRAGVWWFYPGDGVGGGVFCFYLLEICAGKRVVPTNRVRMKGTTGTVILFARCLLRLASTATGATLQKTVHGKPKPPISIFDDGKDSK